MTLGVKLGLGATPLGRAGGHRCREGTGVRRQRQQRACQNGIRLGKEGRVRGVSPHHESDHASRQAV